MSAGGLWDFVTEPAPLAVLAVVALATWPAARTLARRTGCGRPVAALFVLAVGVVAALTLVPNQPVPGVPVAVPPHFLTQVGDPGWSFRVRAPAYVSAGAARPCQDFLLSGTGRVCPVVSTGDLCCGDRGSW